MAELKRNFLKGRMNKDLDERLVSNGEYRDALNIEVSTSEASEVGTVQNLKGNLKVSSLSFKAEGAVKLHNGPADWKNNILNIENAITVANKSNQTTDKIYNFVHRANDLYVSNTIYTGVNSVGEVYDGAAGARFEGIRYDAIREYSPSVTESGGTYKTIFRDIYEVRWAPVFNGSSEPMQDAAGADTPTTVTGLPTNSVDTGFGMQHHPLGIRVGMRVRCLSPSGLDIWSGCEVHVLNILSTSINADNGNGIIQIERPLSGSVYTAGLRSAGYVLQFTAPRVLKFESGSVETESNTTAGNATKTPKHRIITGINIADDLLFFTDGRTEPKKINIKRCKEGTLNSKFAHTKNTSSPNTFFVNESHVAVIRPNPKYPPFVSALGITRPQSEITTDNQDVGITVFDGNLNELHLYSLETTSVVYRYQNGLTGNLAFNSADGSVMEAGETLYISCDTNKVNWRIGDLIKLTGFTTGSVVNVEIIQSWYQGGNFNVFTVRLDENDADAVPNMDGEIWNGELVSKKTNGLYTEKFISFAYRYKYEDGEVSCISPYSTPAFLPGLYSYSSLLAHNEGMTNFSENILLKNFIPTDIPLDVVEVQLLYKDHDFDSVHLFKTIHKRKNTQLFVTDGDGGNHGNLLIESEVFGKMLPDLQKDRLFDHLPRAARAQEFSAGRLMYGNYLKDYNLGTSISATNNNITFYYESREAETVDLGVTNQFHALANGTEHDGRQSISWNWLSAGLWNGFEDMSTVFNAATGVDYISGHAVNNLATGNTDAGLGQMNNVLINSLSNHAAAYGLGSTAQASDGSVGHSFWPAGTFPNESDFAIDGINFSVAEGHSHSQTAVYNKMNFFNQLSDPSSYYVQQNNGDVAVGWVHGEGSLLNPDSMRPFAYMDARWWGRWGFKINFTDEMFDGGGNYDNSDYVIIEDGDNVLDPNVATDFPEDDSRVTHPQTVSTFKLTENGIYKIKAHCRFRCSRAFRNSSTDNTKWAYYVKHPARLAIYRTNSEGVPVGLPLAYSDWNGSNYMHPQNQDIPRENFPFMSQGMPGEANFVAGINSNTFKDWGFNDMFYFGTNNLQNIIDVAQLGDIQKHQKEYRGLEIDATIIVENENDISAQNICARDTSICVVFEACPVGVYAQHADSPNGYATQALDWMNTNAGSNDWHGSPDDPVGDLESQPFILCSIDDITTNYDHTGYGDHIANVADENGNTGNARFEVYEAPSTTGSGVVTRGLPSIKSNRSYDIGVVYGDKFGRESTVITDPTHSSDVSHNASDRVSSFIVRNNAVEIPNWAEYYKFFIRENSSRFSNIVMHKAYDNNPDEDNETYFTWLSFSSAERNKVKEGDYILLKKEHGSNNAVDDFIKSRIVQISNDVPKGQDGELVDTSAAVEIAGPDQAGKFFIKIKWTDDLKYAITGHAENTDDHIFGHLQDPDASINGAVFEVLPSDLDEEDVSDELFGFFFEVSQAYPLRLVGNVAEQYIPVGSRAEFTNLNLEDIAWDYSLQAFADFSGVVQAVKGATSSGFNEVNVPENEVGNQGLCEVQISGDFAYFGQTMNGMLMRFYRPDGSFTEAVLRKKIGDKFYFEQSTANQTIGLSWYNCYSFGNGVESDTINDDFNQTAIYPYTAIGKTSGFKGVLKQDDYKEEWRYNDITFSQLYNEDRGVNGSNQFIIADNITKKLSPAHGSIQKLFARDNDLIALCENKILRILSSGKDALFNADGNMQLLATPNVLGQTIPYSGDYGISKNPESFASDEFRCYFTDRDRGSVLRLSRDGLTPINHVGMKDWFGDHLKFADVAIGSFDGKKDEYNLSIHSVEYPDNKKEVYTLSFSEAIDGWVSFKSFIQESGTSLNNQYYTFKNGELWLHHPETTVNRNLFYSTSTTSAVGTHSIQGNSTVTPVINDMPDMVKTFATLNYEGSQSRIVQAIGDTDGDGDNENFGNNYYNLTSTNGWYVEDIHTDMQEGKVNEFIEKEGKWFNYIQGVTSTFTNSADAGTASTNLDFNEFSTQGLGLATTVNVISGTMAEGSSLIINSANGDGWSTDGLAVYNITEITV